MYRKSLDTTRRGLWMLFAASLFTGPLRAQVSVDQAEVFLEPAGRRVGSFNVTNEGANPAEVTIYLSDWDRDERGEHRFVATGTLPHSCARLLQAFPLSLRLPAGAHQAVRLALNGADSLRQACWSIAFVETSAPAATGGRQITYVTRLGVKIYVLPPGLTKEGDVENMEVVSSDSGKRVAITFHATGGMPLWVHGTLEYRRADNSVAGSDSIAEFPILPGAVRRVLVPMKKLPAGHYLALALLDYRGSEIAAGQIALDIP